MVSRLSEINQEFEVTPGRSVIYLLRLKQTMPVNHAFLVLESIDENGNHLVHFMDFVGESWGTQAIKHPSQNEFGRVRYFSTKKPMNSDEYEAFFKKNQRLIFECRSNMMNITVNAQLYYQAFYISSDDAQQLVNRIKEMKESKKKFPFNILGSESRLSSFSAERSQKEQGDNCFTWAKKQLGELGIKVHCSDTVDWINKNIASITSLTIKENKGTAYCAVSVRGTTLDQPA